MKSSFYIKQKNNSIFSTFKKDFSSLHKTHSSQFISFYQPSRCSTKQSTKKPIRFHKQKQNISSHSLWMGKTQDKKVQLPQKKNKTKNLKRMAYLKRIIDQKAQLYQNFQKAKKILNIESTFIKKKQTQFQEQPANYLKYNVTQKQIDNLNEYQQIRNIRKYYNSINQFQTKNQKFGIQQLKTQQKHELIRTNVSLQRSEIKIPKFKRNELNKEQKRFLGLVKINDIDQVKKMLIKNPELKNIKDQKGLIPIDWIKKRNYKEMEEFFNKKNISFFDI